MNPHKKYKVIIIVVNNQNYFGQNFEKTTDYDKFA